MNSPRIPRNEEQTIAESNIPAAQVDSAYAAWTERARAQWQTYRERTDAPLDSIRAWAGRHPMVVSTTFDNEAGPDFSAVFREAPVIEGTPQDTARLVDYAMQLRDWMAAKDTSALFEAFRFRYAQEYVIYDAPGSVAQEADRLKENVVMDGARLDFEREDVGVRRWSGGRVWEITRKGQPLFVAPGAERDVYVAEIDGALTVVR